MAASPEDKPAPPSAWRTRTSSVLTALAHGSAPFITTFLFVHLTAPTAANIGGTTSSSGAMVRLSNPVVILTDGSSHPFTRTHWIDLSYAALTSDFQMLGREYYQTVFGERYLVFGPLLVHTTSALLKRIFSTPQPSRPLSSALSVTGYAIAFIFLPIHAITHRFAPLSSIPSPSELDYEYVKTALHGWPVRSTVLYTALVLGVALHAADGLGIIWATWAPKTEEKLPRRRARRALAGAAALPVLTGLAVIAWEPLYAFSFTVAQYRASLANSFVYRL
jgi:Protein of unknown function (DUF1691)